MEVIFKLRQLDFMAPPIMLRMGGHTGVKTLFGLVMTLSYLMAAASLSTVMALTFFDTSDPSVSQQQTESGIYPNISLAQNKMFPVLYVFSNGFSPLAPTQVPKYMTPVYTQQEYLLQRHANGTVSTTLNIINMPMVPCSLLKKNETAYKYYREYEETEFYKAYAMEFGLCVQVNEEKAFVKGGGTDSHLFLMSMDLYPCVLPSGCATLPELVQTTFIVSSPTYSLNFSNYEEPVKPYLTGDNAYFINPSSRAKYSSKLRTNEIYDDRGILFSKSLKKNYSEVYNVVSAQRYRSELQLNCTLTQIYNRQCLAYFSFDFASSGRKLTIIRTYKTITKTLSEIGGINSIAFVFFFYLNFMYSQYAKKNILIDKIYDFLQPKKSNSLPPNSGNSSTDSGEELGQIGWNLGDKESVKKLREEAYKSIYDSMDIVTIIREINAIKVLTRVLLKDHHKALLPALALKLDVNERPKTLKIKSGDQIPPDKGEDPKINANGNQSVSKALGFLNGRCKEKERNYDVFREDNLQDMLDKGFTEQLLGNYLKGSQNFSDAKPFDLPDSLYEGCSFSQPLNSQASPTKLSSEMPKSVKVASPVMRFNRNRNRIFSQSKAFELEQNKPEDQT